MSSAICSIDKNKLFTVDIPKSRLNLHKWHNNNLFEDVKKETNPTTLDTYCQ